MDEDASGTLDKAEVTELATQMGWDAPEAVFAKMDQNGDGDVAVSEFRRWWLSSTAEAAAVRAQKKAEDVKISDATRRLMDMSALEAGQLSGLTAGQLAVLT